MDVWSYTQKQDQERTDPRDNESSVGLQKEKIMERRLNWYWHVMRRDEYMLRKVPRMDTRKKDDRKQERHVPTRQEKYSTESGRGDAQGDTE